MQDQSDPAKFHRRNQHFFFVFWYKLQCFTRKLQHRLYMCMEFAQLNFHLKRQQHYFWKIRNNNSNKIKGTYPCVRRRWSTCASVPRRGASRVGRQCGAVDRHGWASRWWQRVLAGPSSSGAPPLWSCLPRIGTCKGTILIIVQQFWRRSMKGI